MMTTKAKPHVVILGAGFGGIHTYTCLRKFLKSDEADITIVDRNNYFLFTPMLHEAATGGLNRQHIIEPIRKVVRRYHDSVLVADIKSIDLTKKIIKTSEGSLRYDYVIIATGATTNYFGIPGAEKHSYTLKSLPDASRLKNHFIDSFEKASRIADDAERKRLLSFAVVGGGATGVELAAEMAELFYETFQAYYEKVYCVKDVALYLVNRGPELLAQFHPDLRDRALKILKEKGVRVRLNSGVKEVKADGLVLDDDSFLPAATTVWVGGVKPNVPDFKHEVELGKGGRIVVDDFLRIVKYDGAHAMGDVAHFGDTNGRPLPMLAQVATRQSETLAGNISRSMKGRPLKEFWYRSRGELVSLGQWRALGNVFHVRMSGPHIWWLWRTVYLSKFNSWSKRIKIAIDWTVNMFAPRDIAKTE